MATSTFLQRLVRQLRQTAASRQLEHASDADGKFRVLGLPGKGYMLSATNTNEYLKADERSGDGGTKRDNLPTLPHTVVAGNYHAFYVVDIPSDADPYRRPVTFEAKPREKRQEPKDHGNVQLP